jgi:protein-S-isoprenylcysteine O-methyltransferase Ste14
MPDIFKVAREEPHTRLFAKAMLQTACFWTFFLVIVPACIVWFENTIGIRRFDIGGWKVPIALAFCLSGSIGIYCAWLFAKIGKGTPIPFASPRGLVIRGPYRYIRNPMATLGIAQGVLVGVGLGSWITIVYSVLGGIGWHCLARPAEDRDLAARHGEAFTRYKRAVRCWLPRLKPYEPEP